MKIYLLTVFSLLFITLSQAQRVQSSCTGPDSIIARYRNDADRLAVRRFYRNNLHFKDSILIPSTYSDTVLRALMAVYNAKNLAARDTVVDMFNIHTFAEMSLSNLMVGADSGEAWMKQLRLRNIPTGNTTVDNLINKYKLSVASYTALRSLGYHIVSFKSTGNYNMPALARLFETIPGVYYSNMNFVAGDGSNIKDSIHAGHVELVYSYGWGDCPAGCTHRRYWKFNVYHDCSVELDSIYGSPLYHVGTTAPELKFISVHPNPFNQELMIDGLTGAFEYSICNALGQELVKGKSADGKILNLHSLHAGTYILSIQTGDRAIMLKILKN